MRFRRGSPYSPSAHNKLLSRIRRSVVLPPIFFLDHGYQQLALCSSDTRDQTRNTNILRGLQVGLSNRQAVGSVSFLAPEQLMRHCNATAPQTLGILFSSDALATQCLELCNQSPHSAAFLGIGNDLFDCQRLGLSSIELASDQIGYEACSHLVRSLQDRPPTAADSCTAVRAVVERETTPFNPTAKGSVRAAIHYIEASNFMAIRVSDVSAHCQVSRRTLEYDFRAVLGLTVYQMIQRVKLEHVKRLLRASDLTLEQIADSLGLGSARNLCRFFAAHTGATPGSYRLRHSRPTIG